MFSYKYGWCFCSNVTHACSHCLNWSWGLTPLALVVLWRFAANNATTNLRIDPCFIYAAVNYLIWDFFLRVILFERCWSIYPEKQNKQPFEWFYCSYFWWGVFLTWATFWNPIICCCFSMITPSQYNKCFLCVRLFSVPIRPHDRVDVLSSLKNVHSSQEPHAFCLSLTKTINKKNNNNWFHTFPKSISIGGGNNSDLSFKKQ